MSPEERKAGRLRRSELLQSWIGKLFFGLLFFMIPALAILLVRGWIAG